MPDLPRVWFERPLLPDLVEEVESRVAVLGPGTPSEPYAGIETAQGVVAGMLLYDEDAMARAPKLRVIARTGIGVDRVDLGAATRRSIAVCNAPDAPTTSTAEHTIALMLAVAKRLEESAGRLRRGESDLYARHEGIELNGKRLGLVGFGRIARKVASIARGLGMEVQAFDPFLDNEDMVGATPVASLNDVLSTSDVLSLHVPLTDESHGMIGAEELKRMKESSLLINTARGGLVDHDALLAALESGRLFGAGLDVTDPEPLPQGHPLLERADVVVTPHTASGTGAGKRRLFRTALEQVVQVLGGTRPPHLVNPEVWDTSGLEGDT